MDDADRPEFVDGQTVYRVYQPYDYPSPLVADGRVVKFGGGLQVVWEDRTDGIQVDDSESLTRWHATREQAVEAAKKPVTQDYVRDIQELDDLLNPTA